MRCTFSEQDFLSSMRTFVEPEPVPVQLIVYEEDSIFSRYVLKSCIAAWLFFIIYEILIRCDQVYSREPLCPYDDDFGKFYWYSCYGVFGGFLLIFCSVILKIFHTKKKNRRAPLILALNIVAIGNL
jgi:hypothetical protein